MAALPSCTIVNPKDTKEEFTQNTICEELKGWIGADCWGIAVNGEVLFNSYNEDKPLLQKIQDDMIRHHILDHTHSSITMHVYRSQKDAVVDIYMYGDTPWKAQYSYSAETKIWTLERFYSEEYVQVYGFDESK